MKANQSARISIITWVIILTIYLVNKNAVLDCAIIKYYIKELNDCLTSIEDVTFFSVRLIEQGPPSRHEFEAQLARNFLSGFVLTKISAARKDG